MLTITDLVARTILAGSIAAAAAITCGDNLPPDDGFGGPCTVDLDAAQLFTPCVSLLGEAGVCEQITTGDPTGICRRWCRGTEVAPGACPEGQRAVSIVGDRCLCLPQSRRSEPQRTRARRRAAQGMQSPLGWRRA